MKNGHCRDPLATRPTCSLRSLHHASDPAQEMADLRVDAWELGQGTLHPKGHNPDDVILVTAVVQVEQRASAVTLEEGEERAS